jgi:hypothetical protein
MQKRFHIQHSFVCKQCYVELYSKMPSIIFFSIDFKQKAKISNFKLAFINASTVFSLYRSMLDSIYSCFAFAIFSKTSSSSSLSNSFILMLLPLIFVTAHTATCFCNASPAQWFLCLPGCCDAGLWLAADCPVQRFSINKTRVESAKCNFKPGSDEMGLKHYYGPETKIFLAKRIYLDDSKRSLVREAVD